MKYFALPNLNWLDVEEVYPPTMPTPPLEFESKKEFRDWCNDKGTKHCFYSCVEAINPYHRVTVENPAFKMYGLVVDYDADYNEKTMLAAAEHMADDLRPRWFSRTQSGFARVVWEFEAPVMVDNEAITERFIDALVKLVDCDRYSMKIDRTSFKLSQYFELGRDWKEVPDSSPIPSATLSSVFVKAATAKTIKGEANVPLEHVAKEVESRFPGRWAGEFVEGARGPLFWIQDGIDRVGCQVGQFGMLCFSDRAGKSFLHWGEIFGPDFVRQFEAERIGAAADGVWFDGQKYWRKNEDGQWRARNKDDTIMYLKGEGVSAAPKAVGMASDAEKVLLTAQNAREVKAAAPIVLDNREIVFINGEKYLNISAIRVIEPAESATPADFPWIYEFINNVWADPAESQRDHYLGWLQHYYRSGQAGRLQQGQAVFMAGPTSIGKTFWNRKVIGLMMGGYGDPTHYLLGTTNFNKQDSEVAHWAVDDPEGATTWENKAKFAANVKKHVANPQVRCEGKNQNALILPWAGRMQITCNTDEKSLEIIPPLDDNLLDKVSLYWLSETYQPTFLPNYGSEPKVAAELPYFCRWLLDWKTPDYVLNHKKPRFHVNPFHHKNMLLHAHNSSSAARLMELLDEWREQFSAVTACAKADEMGCCWMTATKLRKEVAADPSARDALKEFSRNRMAEALEQLGPEYVVATRSTKGVKEYYIRIFTPEAAK